MKKNHVKKYMRRGEIRRVWKKAVSILSCIVVFVTTYMLLLPAITMERTAICGIEAHQHDESCWETETKLTCGMTEEDGHQHTDDCFTTTRKLICTLEQHTHSAQCYNTKGQPSCALEEHSHTDECFREDRLLSCPLEETADHQHTEDCYEREKVLICGKEAHTHTPECFEEEASELSSGAEEEAPEEGFNETFDAAESSTPDESISDENGAENIFDESGDEAAGMTDSETAELSGNNEETETGADDTEILDSFDGSDGFDGSDEDEASDSETADPSLEDGEIETVAPETGENYGENETSDSETGDNSSENETSDAETAEPSEENEVSDAETGENSGENETSDAEAGENSGENETSDAETAESSEENGISDAETADSSDENGPDDAGEAASSEGAESTEAAAEAAGEGTEGTQTASESAPGAASGTTSGEAKPGLSKTLTFEGPDYTVTAIFDETAGIPAGASLSVEEITQDQDNYKKYSEQAEKAVGEEIEGKAAWVRLFDITIVKDGQPIEPTGPVSVQINYHEAMERPKNAEVKAVHFEGEKETPVVLDTKAQGEETSVEQVSFDTESFSVFAIVGTTIEKTVLASDGNNYKVTVTCGEDAGVPESAELNVAEITDGSSRYGKTYEEYVSSTESVLGLAEGSAEYIRLFDIKIVDKDGGWVQIAEGATVDVKIELSDAESDSLSVIHFADEEETGTVLETTTSTREEGQAVEFQTDGFSVYAIVDAPAPYVPEAATVVNLDEFYNIADYEQAGFYLSIKNPQQQYFSNSLNSGGCFIEETDLNRAAVWYFEPSESGQNQYYIYTKLNGVKKYIKQTSENSNNVSLTDFPGTVFVLEKDDSSQTFYIKHAGQKRWLQHSNGGLGIRFYTDKNNKNNSQITMTYASSISIPDDYYGLDGTTIGIVYDSESLYCTALMQEQAAEGSLHGQDIVKLDTKGYSDRLFIPLDSDITEWTFHTAGEDNYYLTTEVDGTVKYLTIRDGFAGLSGTPGEDSLIRVVPGSGDHSGFYSFSTGGVMLTADGPEGSRFFTGSNESSPKQWMKLAEKSPLTEDDYLIYTARKMGVSDPVEQVILYTRVWNGSQYEFYAVDYDGSLIRCYDEGDVIKWVGNQYETAVWELTDYYNQDEQGNPTTPTGYYELKNTYSGEFIAPKLAGNSIFSDKAAYLNLDGRYYQEDSTDIRCWDNTYYSYIGLKADLESGKAIPCTSSQADRFYFARIKEPQSHLTEVDTVDNDEFGVTIKMIDFNNPIVNQRDSKQTEFFGRDSDKIGLLTTDIKSDGYPGTTYNNSSLGDLFAGNTEANHLFIQSVYDESGYFEYDSTKNFAYLNGSVFEVYDQLGTVERAGNRPTSRHGQFMPYNSLINPATEEPWPYSDMYTNTTTVLGTDLPTDDPRYGEGLHEIPASEANYFLGMEMSASFTQTKDGVDAWGHDIIFDFSGDDDFWFYVDGELVLDLGGVHSAMTGSVNFRTGIVTGRNGNTKTLRQIFESNYRARNPGAGSEEVNNYLRRFFEDGKTVFRDYSTHEMKVYYMERGAGASNLYMRFNLTAVKPGEVTLTKEVTGSDDIDFDLMEFPYQILYRTRDGDQFDEENTPWRRLSQSVYNPAVTYQGSKRPVAFSERFTPVGSTETYQDVFFLKPGEIASIDMPVNTYDYKIVECGVNMDIFKSVKANGEILSGEGDTGRHNYETSPSSIEDKPEAKFENEVDPDSLRTLTITKILWDENGFKVVEAGTDEEMKVGNKLNGYDDDAATFDLRISMAAQDTAEMTPARYKKYFIKDFNQDYCRWDAQKQQFVSLGIHDYSALVQYLSGLTEDERTLISFETSRNGAVSMVPAGFSIEFRGLPVNSSFRVEERNEEIPAGYSFLEYERDRGSYISEEEPNQGTIRANQDPHIMVHNKRGWGLTVKKVWSDVDFMVSHDDIFFAVYIKNHDTDEYELLEGSVRRLAAPASSVYYYFDELKEGTTFEDYKVSEVRLTDPVIAENGIVTYSSIEEIEEGESLNIGGTPKDRVHQDGFSYKVFYTEGEPFGGDEEHKNVREDTATNIRRGIWLRKEDWNGTALPGAGFTLKDNEGNPVGTGTYTSDAEGMITIAYLHPEISYLLEETEPPNGFQKPSPWTITMNQDETVTVEGDEGTWEITPATDPATDNEIAEITFKNKGFSLQALKVMKDASGGPAAEKRLEGAVFALYRQVETISGFVRDQHPMHGYEALTTGADGVIPQITSALPAGSYYLSEVNPPAGYSKIQGDLVFTISTEGIVEIPASVETADPASLIILNNLTDPDVQSWISQTESEGHVTYTILIPNESAGVPVRLIKTDQEGHLLEGAVFTFSGETLPETITCTSERNTMVIGENTVEEALIYENETLPIGIYTLTETGPPSGFIPPEGPVTIEVKNIETGIIVTAMVNGQTNASARTERIDVNHPEYGWRVIIMNTTGYELPSTGGPGTRLFYILGCTIIIVAGLVMKAMRKNRDELM